MALPHDRLLPPAPPEMMRGRVSQPKNQIVSYLQTLPRLMHVPPGLDGAIDSLPRQTAPQRQARW